MALHMTPVNTTATITEAVTSPKPFTRTTGTAHTAMNAICTAVNATGSKCCDNVAPRKIQIANINAQPSVSASPTPRLNDAPEIRNRPTAHTATPTSTLRVGARRVTTVSTSGVNTTNKPVMNAEFDVVVRCSPAFWSQ